MNTSLHLGDQWHSLELHAMAQDLSLLADLDIGLCLCMWEKFLLSNNRPKY